MQSEKNVCYGLWSDGIIGLLFFKNDAGSTVTVNEFRYRVILKEFMFPKINDFDEDDMCFQQDHATCHTANEIIDFLKEKIGDYYFEKWICQLAPKIMRFNISAGLLFMGFCIPINYKYLTQYKTYIERVIA